MPQPPRPSLRPNRPDTQERRAQARFRHARRLLRLQTFHPLHHPRFGRPKLPRRFSTRQISWIAGPIVVLMLLLFMGQRYVAQRVDIENILRRQIIPQLEAQIGQDIEVGAIESDWISQIVLNDVVVGRNAQLPTGALLQTKRAIINLNLVSLALRRDEPLAALSSVRLESPQVYVHRNRDGQLNLLDLWKPQPDQEQEEKWTGTITAINGRIFFEDDSIRNTRGAPLTVDLRQVALEADLNGDAPVTLAVSSPSALVGPQRIEVRNTALRGNIDSDGKWLALNVDWPRFPAPLLTDYAFPKGDAVATTGAVGGQVKTAYDETLPEGERVLVNGLLNLQNVSLQAKALNEPGTKNPLPLKNINGPVEVNGSTLETSGLTLSTLDTPLRVVGSMAIVEPPIFNLNFYSESAATARLVEAARRASGNDSPLRQLQLSGGRAQAALNFSGTIEQPSIETTIEIPDVAARHPEFGAWSTPRLKLAVNYQEKGQSPLVSATLSTPTLRGSRPDTGQFRSGALQAEIDFTGVSDNARAQVRFRGQNLKVNSVRYGSASAPAMNGVLRWDAAAPNRPLKLAARFTAPALQVQIPRQGQVSLNNADGAVQLTGSGPNAQITARVNGSSLDVRHSQQGNWQLRQARASLEYSARNNTGAAQVRAAASAGRHPQQGQVRTGQLRVRAGWSGTGRAQRAAARWELDGVTAQHREYGFLQAASLNGQGRWQNGGGAGGVAQLRNFRLANRRYGNLNGQALNVVASTANLQNPRWNGNASVSNVNASGINFAALSPEAANRVRDIGLVSGVAQFQNIGGENLLISADLSLSRATILDERFDRTTLRDVRARVDYSNGDLELTNVRVQSEFGVLEAAFSTNRADGLQFSLTAPRLVVSAARLNPFLASQNIRLTGTAVGRLQVRSVAANTYNTDFDFSLGQARIRRAVGNSASTLRADGARLRGEGVLRVGGTANWSFNGDTVFFAKSADLQTRGQSTPVPVWLDGSRTENLRVAASGSLSETGGEIQPNLAGQVTTSEIAVPLPGSTPSTLTVQNVTSDWAAQPDQIQLSQISLDVAGGSATGHATLKPNNARTLVAGQLLLEEMSAARLQTLASSLTGPSEVQISGQTFARADFNGYLQDLQAQIQARLYNGALSTPQAQEPIPIDAARADFTIGLPFTGRVPIQDATLWSRGGRFHVDGEVEKQGEAIALDLHAVVNTLRAKDVLALPVIGEALASARRQGDIAGLLSGDLQITGTAPEPRVTGRAALRLASAFGINVDEATTQVLFETREGAPFLRFDKLEGRAEDAPFEGSFEADFSRNLWAIDLETEELPAGQILAAADRVQASEAPANQQLRTLPLRGALRADIQLTGTLRGPNGEASLQPQEGVVKLQTDAMRWRGLPLGALDAALELNEGRLKVQTVELRDEETGVVRLKLEGEAPLSTRDNSLNLQLALNDEPIAFFIAALEEARATLLARGQSTAGLQPIFTTLEKLPPDLQGRVDIKATLTNSLDQPIVKVESLMVRDAKLRAPAGNLQKLPTLKAAFTYDAGAVTVQEAELRLASEDKIGEEEDEGDDTVLRVFEGARIVPGQEISLQADLLNAHLAQLAPWIPALRGPTGRPMLTGELSQFTFQVTGTPEDPQLIGSLLAENLNYQEYSIDRLRVSRFDVGNGAFEIRPGNLTVVKGDFQSQVAWGKIPWSWEQPGPVMDAPMEVHLPLATRDFGALAGVFVPAITNVGADNFEGRVDITGTLADPRISGEAAIDDGRFRLEAAGSPFEAGVQNISGRVLFVNGNQIQIDPERPFQATLVKASAVEAPTTGNASGEERAKNIEGAKPRPKVATNLGGQVEVQGGITLDLDPRNLAQPVQSLAEHNYNLRLRVRDGEYSTANFSGVKNVEMAALWQTGEGAPSLHQNVRWLLSATSSARTKNPGRLLSMAALRLNPSFAASVDELARPDMQTFNDFSEFEDTPIFAGLPLQAFRALPTRQSQIVLDNLAWTADGVGSGVLAGTITMDNVAVETDFVPQPFGPPRPSLARRLRQEREKNQNSSLLQRASDQAVLTQTTTRKPDKPEPAPKVRTISNSQRLAQALPDTQVITLADFETLPPVRFAGALTLSSARLSGAPSGEGGGTLLALPDVPAFEIRVVLGENVRFQAATLRTDLAGEAEVLGTPRNPYITGTFFTRAGQVSFPNSRVRIEEGEVQVTITRDPILNTLLTRVELDVTARGTVDRYTITLEMKGPLELGPIQQDTQNLQITVTSNPPLSQGEAFEKLLGTSLLNARSGDNDLLETSTSDRYKSAIVGLLSAPLFSSIERSLEQALGLSSVSFEYRFNEALGVEVGKAIGDRVYITYRRTIDGGSGSSGPTPYDLRIEYRIRGNLNIGVQTDERERHQITVEKSWRF